MISITSLVIMAAIAGAGALFAPLVQSLWLMRTFIASLIALLVVMLLPDAWALGTYGSVLVFAAITVLLLVAHQWRFFDADHWHATRFSARVFVFGICFAFFIAATVCVLVPLRALPDLVMTKDVYHFLTTYYFYFVLTPIAVALAAAR